MGGIFLCRWLYGIPHSLISEWGRECGGLRKGCKVGNLHARGAYDKNNGKSSNCGAFLYPEETIDQRLYLMVWDDVVTNFFAVVDLELGSAMSALTICTST